MMKTDNKESLQHLTLINTLIKKNNYSEGLTYLIQKYCTNQLLPYNAKKVINDLVTIKISEGNENGNCFYWLIKTLISAIEYKRNSLINEIIGFFKQLIKQSEIEDVVDGLSIASKEGKNKGINGVYLLAKAMAHHHSYYYIQLYTLLNQCENKNKLIQGFLAKAKRGNHKGINGFYWLTQAVYQATNYNYAEEIIKYFIQLIEHDKTHAVYKSLLITTNKNKETTSGLYWLVASISNIIKEQKLYKYYDKKHKKNSKKNLRMFFSALLHFLKENRSMGEDSNMLQWNNNDLEIFNSLIKSIYKVYKIGTSSHQLNNQIMEITDLLFKQIKNESKEIISIILTFRPIKNNKKKPNNLHWLTGIINAQSASDKNNFFNRLITSYCKFLKQSIKIKGELDVIINLVSSNNSGCNAFYFFMNSIINAVFYFNLSENKIIELFNLMTQLCNNQIGIDAIIEDIDILLDAIDGAIFRNNIKMEAVFSDFLIHLIKKEGLLNVFYMQEFSQFIKLLTQSEYLLNKFIFNILFHDVVFLYNQGGNKKIIAMREMMVSRFVSKQDEICQIIINYATEKYADNKQKQIVFLKKVFSKNNIMGKIIDASNKKYKRKKSQLYNVSLFKKKSVTRTKLESYMSKIKKSSIYNSNHERALLLQ